MKRLRSAALTETGDRHKNVFVPALGSPGKTRHAVWRSLPAHLCPRSRRAVNFCGEFFRYENGSVLPKPVQRPHPRIWVGASRSDDLFHWAGQNGFDLMTLPYLYADICVLQRLVKIYRQSLTEAGHDAAQHEVLGKFHIYVAESFDRAVREATPYLDHYAEIHRAADPDREHAPANPTDASRRSIGGAKRRVSPRCRAHFTSVACRRSWP